MEAKRRIAEPLLEGLAKLINSLAESQALERLADATGTVVSSGLKAATSVQEAVSRAGSTATPTLVQAATTAGDIAGRIIRLGICTLVCPIQTGEDKEKCQKEHCGKQDRSDNLDYYDGDFEESYDDDV